MGFAIWQPIRIRIAGLHGYEGELPGRAQFVPGGGYELSGAFSADAHRVATSWRVRPPWRRSKACCCFLVRIVMKLHYFPHSLLSSGRVPGLHGLGNDGRGVRREIRHYLEILGRYARGRPSDRQPTP